MKSKYESIAEKMAEAPLIETSWRPQEPGDFTGGHVEDIKTANTAYGKIKVLNLRTKSGEVVSVWLTKVLERKVDQIGINPDDEIVIKYFGEGVSAKTGNTYKKFDLQVVERG